MLWLPRKTSPNIDRFARDWTQFENAYSPSGWTVPSFASLLIGQYPPTHQVVEASRALPDAATTFPEYLQENGYETAFFMAKTYLARKRMIGLAQNADYYWMAKENRYTSTQYEEAIAWLGEGRNQPFFLFFHTFDCHAPYLAPPPYHEAFLNDAYYRSDTDLRTTDPDRWKKEIVDVSEWGVHPRFVKEMNGPRDLGLLCFPI